VCSIPSYKLLDINFPSLKLIPNTEYAAASQLALSNRVSAQILFSALGLSANTTSIPDSSSKETLSRLPSSIYALVKFSITVP